MMHLARRATDKFVRLCNKIHEIEKKKVIVCGSGSILYPSCSVDNFASIRDAIVVGANTHVRGQLLVFPNGGKITVGDFCYVGENSKIWSMDSITIGHHVLISHGVNIHDNISHSLSAESRRQHIAEIFIGKGHPKILNDVPSKAIVIEDDAWIGFNATILKGVTIGRGAVVGACSVVTQDIPPYVIVAGNPAKFIGEAML